MAFANPSTLNSLLLPSPLPRSHSRRSFLVKAVSALCLFIYKISFLFLASVYF
ncbi:hypothetical protein HYC85_027110 [Camellia sinensis]|uniref:Uncharacterized protein n=1 Tax=Camellia sinensis TaxID=4442 RepID=A0A7J7G7T2_CAMSI|nr:hypothetical protein HYC85_027110 [Camellia sinensis]